MLAMGGKVVILCFIAFSHVLCTKLVEGTTSTSMESEDDSFTVKCVDIYKQPAFSNPLLKNHTLQMRPTSTPSGFNETISWQGYEKCPQGTIPIAKSQLFKKGKTGGFIRNSTHTMTVPSNGHEYAQVSLFDGASYYGAQASLNIWNPFVANPGEFSLSQIWVLGGDGPNLNTVEVGWQALHGNGFPRLFVFWTRNNYQGTGCYNLECPGFIQTNRNIVLGGRVTPVSFYGKKQFELQVAIHKDKVSGNWWVRIGKEDLGYWPRSILTTLAESSNGINWGGEIVNMNIDGKHTSTDMGSGYYSKEGLGKAAFIGNIGYVDENGAIVVPDTSKLVPFVTNAACYDLQFGQRGTQLAQNFFFGGPGFSPRCP